MTTPARLRVAVEGALAIAAVHLPAPTVADAHAICAGRLHLWEAWPVLDAADRLAIARFLRARPAEASEWRRFASVAAEILSEGLRFEEVQVDGERCRPQDVRYAPHHCSAMELRDDRLKELLRTRARGARRVSADAGADAGLRLTAGEISFQLPPGRSNPAAEPLALRPASGGPVTLERKRVLEFAGRLDGQAGFRVPTMTRLFDELRDERGAVGERITLAPGPTQLFVAPTGGGKSVLSALAALGWAASGRAVCIVVPRIADTLQLAHELERSSEALGLRLKVVALNGADAPFTASADALEHPPAHDRDGMWTLSKLGYTCQLAAYADEGEVRFGDEPCDNLAHRVGRRTERVACPFSASCPKYQIHRDALSADIIVINHSAFLLGVWPSAVPVQDAGSSRLTLREVVLRRCDVVLIDEVDQFQAKVIEDNSGTFELSSLGHLSLIQQFYGEFELRRARGEIPRNAPVGALRQYLHLVSWVAEELADHLNAKTLRWSGRNEVRWSGGSDAWLARHLYGRSAGRLHRLNALFAAKQPEQEVDRPLWSLVRRLSRRPPDDRESAEEHREAIRAALAGWRWSTTATDEIKSGVVDGIFLRATLERVERALHHLRPLLTGIEEWDLAAASRLRDQLLGLQAWAPSPLGPLGRQVVGFSFEKKPEVDGVLKAHALTGDPHSIVRGLGDEIALGVCGSQRVVLGLSATGRFHGSPRNDIVGDIAFYQPDIGGGVEVRGITVRGRESGSGDEPLRVSGVAANEGRLERVREMARELWATSLESHLEALAADDGTRERARVLLVTGSYIEALAAGSAIGLAMGDTARAREWIRVLDRTHDPASWPPRILPREVEGFARSGARILIAPLSVIARGYNIMRPDGSGSAIASVFVLVRPVPPIDSAARALAHVSYDAWRRAEGAPAPGIACQKERSRAEGRLRRFQEFAGPLSLLPRDLRHELLCDVLVDIAQLAGRARRSRDRVQLYLVDGAFHVDGVGWRQQLREAFKRWRQVGAARQMLELHRGYLTALGRFAGLDIG